MTAPYRRPCPTRAFSLDGGDDIRCSLAEAHHALIEHDVVVDLAPGSREAIGHPSGKAAAAIEEVSNPVAAERSKERPAFDASRPLGRLGCEVHRRTGVARREIGGARAHALAKRGGASNERHAAVIGRVQPFVGVGRPGVRCVESTHPVGQPRRGGRPKAERAIDVNPRVGVVRPFDQGFEWVARTAVDVARLEANDGGAASVSH